MTLMPNVTCVAIADRALLIEMWTAAAYGDYRRTQGG